MRIEKIKIENFRIYRGVTEVSFPYKEGKNINLIAGKNGFGKTTFLTSLIWVLYGKQMTQVEEKYRQDVRNVGGYDLFLHSLLNRDVKREFKAAVIKEAYFKIDLVIRDILIPSVPCDELRIIRSFDFAKKQESLEILIDGQENELTKQVGYEVFINDFILPREIAKFFFFDAEKVVSLAEAKTKDELRALSRAYSEVLGIKKYEDLKKSLSMIQTKLRLAGANDLDREKVNDLEREGEELRRLIGLNQEKLNEVNIELEGLRLKSDQLQEQLIREGNAMTLDELKALKEQAASLEGQFTESKTELKKLTDIVPLAIAKEPLRKLVEQLKLEQKLKKKVVDRQLLKEELQKLQGEFSDELKSLNLSKLQVSQLSRALAKLVERREGGEVPAEGEIILDYDDETTRSIISTYNYVIGPFKEQFERIVKREKELRQELSRVRKKIAAGEVRKDNPIAKQLRTDKEEVTERSEGLLKKKGVLEEEMQKLNQQLATNQRILSEESKLFRALETDIEKYKVNEALLQKISRLTARIKEEKKYALQNSILLGLNKLMHKNHLVKKVNVRIEGEVMDIDLIDQFDQVIDKDVLSKGEQQLYATALLKALVDQSGIDFPVFIDSPLQKFDKEHSSNVIQQFYPSISDQVVLFPLLEKELTKAEFQLLQPNLNKVLLIDNDGNGSSIAGVSPNQLFIKFNQQHVLAH